MEMAMPNPSGQFNTKEVPAQLVFLDFWHENSLDRDEDCGLRI